jgi:two-component system, sensor histidine kinase and response regulator
MAGHRPGRVPTPADLAAILDAAPFAVVMLSADGLCRGENRVARELLGQLGDRALLEVIVPADRPAVAERLADPDGRPLEVKARRPDGTAISVELTLVPCPTDDGELVGAYLRPLSDVAAAPRPRPVDPTRDSTEHRRVRAELDQAKEAAGSALRARSDFLARMSHEIRTPLNGVLGMIDLSLVCELTPEVRDNLETARSSADLLLTLVNDILDFSKVDAGKLRLDYVPFVLREMVASALRGVGGRAFAKGLGLILDVHDDVPARVVGDPQRFQQVLVNLVANAIKFTERGEIVVEISAAAQTAGELFLIVTVSDTGIGIPPEEQTSIFDAFHQVDSATARSTGGTGLGLAICRELVTLMGGAIAVESDPASGSRFTFSFKLRPAPAAIAAPVAPPAFRGARVLVVERNARQREQLARMLRALELMPVLVDANDPAALDAVRGAYRLVLVDAQTPATPMARLARRLGLGALAGPEVILLAPSGCKIAAEIQKLAPVAQVTKPILGAQLFDALVAVFGGAAVPVPTLPMRPVSARPRRRILLAEDNAINRRVARGFLERVGADVVEVENGRAALDALERGEHDLVLMDVEMPVMGGLDAIRVVRERERALGIVRLPIVAVTAQAMVGDEERCLEAGADAYIAKPFNPRELAAVIDRLAPVASSSTGPIMMAPVSTPVPGHRILDRAELLHRIGGKAEIYAEIIGMFLTEAPRLRAELARVVKGGDREGMRRIAHKLKGMLASMSAPAAAAVARKLEEDLDEGGEHVAELAGRLDKTLLALEAELAHETAS